MDHAWGARPDCRVVLKKKPTASLEKFYFDTITFDRTMLRQMVQRYGADHVLLGTDYPYDMGMEQPLDFIEGVTGLSRKEKEMIEGGNAARLLKIDYNKVTRRRRT
jgi:aminocarboxymuconate-semialdehyde decarboxylase